MEKAKTKKLNRKEKAEIERKTIEKKLLKTYVEGDSNIDFDKIKTAEEVWEARLFRFASGKKPPLMSKKKWLSKEIAKIEADKSKVPTHRVQDPNAKFAKYRQKFVETAIKLHPKIFNDLRKAVANYKALFDNQPNVEYFNTFDELKLKLLEYQRIKPDHDKSFLDLDRSYHWGALQTAFNLSSIKNHFSNPKLSDLRSEKMKQQIEINKHTLESFANTVEETFQETAADKDSILSNFFSLQSKIYDWVKKYHFRKDWLVDYAYYFIHQLNQNPKLKAKNIEVGVRLYDLQKTVFYSFDFNAEGWRANEDGETANQYKARVTKEFTEQLDHYINTASVSLQLAELPKATKPASYKSLEWLVCSTVRDWNSEKIAEKFFPDISADRTKSEESAKKFNSTKKHIENEIRKLKEYGLPLRDNL